MKQKEIRNKTESSIELVFEKNRIKGVWYHPKIAPLLCALCKEKNNCDNKKCHNTNPYCG